MNPESPSRQTFLPLGVEACRVFLDVGPNVEPPVCWPEQGILRSDPERSEQRTVAADSHLPFPLAGDIKVYIQRKAHSITKNREHKRNKEVGLLPWEGTMSSGES